MNFITDLLSLPIIAKLGWVLFHSLWQGIAVAAVLAIVLKIFRKSSAALRYLLCCAALILMILLPVITFNTVQTERILPTVSAGNLLPSENQNIVEIKLPQTEIKNHPVEIAPVEAKQSLKQRFTSAAEPILPYAVLCWFCGVIVLSIWYLGGWMQLQKLRSRMLKKVPYQIAVSVKNLCAKLKINRLVNIAESVLVEAPVVIGHLKPIILLPASAISGLDIIQIESIIAHELAHIKRCDYLVNIFQTVIEILLFYHPAVWWLSAKIRVERENCCDDIAVKLTGNNIEYASALAAMEEIRTAQWNLAVAANGGNLLNRVRRLLMSDNGKKEKSFLPSILVLILMFAIAIPVSFTLASANVNKDLNTNVITDANLNLSISIPAEWQYSKQSDPAPYKFLWQMTMPVENSEALFIGTNLTDSLSGSVRQIAAGDITVLKNYFNNYVVKESSWFLGKIAGRPTATFAADFIYNNLPMVEYRTYILDEKMVYWFVFRIEKNLFEKNKSQFDSVVNSFMLKNAAENTETKNDVDITASDFKLNKNNRGVYNLTVSIKNNSDKIIPQFKLRYYRGDIKNNCDEAGNPHSGWHNAGPIKAGDTWNESARGFMLADGRYKFSAVLDYPNEIAETNENNNEISTNVNILGSEILSDTDYAKTLTEDFFRHNYRDITERKTIEWGQPTTDANNNISIRYKYIATIWGKDKIITNQLFVFDKNGNTVSFNKIEEDKKLETAEEKPQTYIVKFQPKNGFNPKNAKQLLEPFNAAIKYKVNTHHFRTKAEKGKLIGYILCDGSAEQKAIKIMLAKSNKIEFVNATPVMTDDKLAEHYASEQESLGPVFNAAEIKNRLSQNISVKADKSPDGNRLTIQYAVMAICKASAVPYNWDKSAKLAEPQRRNFIKPLDLKNVRADIAIKKLIRPLGLDYEIEDEGIYLYKKKDNSEKLTSSENVDTLQIEIQARCLFLDKQLFENLNLVVEPNQNGIYFMTEAGEKISVIDNAQAEKIIAACKDNENSKFLTAPKVTVLNNEQAHITIAKEVEYISDYNDADGISEKPQANTDTITSKLTLKVLPKLTDDAIMLNTECEYIWADLLDATDEKGHSIKKPYTKTAKITLNNARTAVIQTKNNVESNKTLLLGISEIKKDLDNQLQNTNLVILIKAKEVK